MPYVIAAAAAITLMHAIDAIITLIRRYARYATPTPSSFTLLFTPDIVAGMLPSLSATLAWWLLILHYAAADYDAHTMTAISQTCCRDDAEMLMSRFR